MGALVRFVPRWLITGQNKKRSRVTFFCFAAAFLFVCCIRAYRCFLCGESTRPSVQRRGRSNHGGVRRRATRELPEEVPVVPRVAHSDNPRRGFAAAGGGGRCAQARALSGLLRAKGLSWTDALPLPLVVVAVVVVVVAAAAAVVEVVVVVAVVVALMVVLLVQHSTAAHT
jgi:hypothetical protein